MKGLLTIAGICAGCVHPTAPSVSRLTPGTLPGETHGVAEITVMAMRAKTVTPDGDASERSGILSTARYRGGMYFALTEFGTASGVEITAGLGHLQGAAASVADGRAEKHLFVEGEIGGVVQPIRVNAGPVVARIAGDFGLGFTLDDRYAFAGGRLGLGAASRRVAVDLSARRHFGDTPGNSGAYEDRARLVVTARPSLKRRVHIYGGVEFVRGDKRSLGSDGAEISRDDYLLRGRYDGISAIIAIGLGPEPGELLRAPGH